MCKSINGVLSPEHGVNLTKNKGFTLIEALVSLALFAIAFSGLYFFFGMAQQANNNSEKRIYLNLMTNQIIETIHAEAFRADGDILSPFVTPASYNANLSDCSTYSAPDVRHTWCTELNAAIGPHKGVHADEVRTVEVVKDETNLIVNVTLVADGGIGDKNLIKTFLSRKIAAPRRSGLQEICFEKHALLLANTKAEKAKCDAGTIPSLQAKWWSNFSGGYGTMERVWNVSCPDYINLPGSGAGDPLTVYTVGESPEIRLFWHYYLKGKNTYLDEDGVAQTDTHGYTRYVSPYYWAMSNAGDHQLLSSEGGFSYTKWDATTAIYYGGVDFCTPGSTYYQGNIAGNDVDCPSDEEPSIFIKSCCPAEEIRNRWGTHDKCDYPLTDMYGGSMTEAPNWATQYMINKLWQGPPKRRP